MFLLFKTEEITSYRRVIIVELYSMYTLRQGKYEISLPPFFLSRPAVAERAIEEAGIE